MSCRNEVHWHADVLPSQSSHPQAEGCYAHALLPVLAPSNRWGPHNPGAPRHVRSKATFTMPTYKLPVFSTRKRAPQCVIRHTGCRCPTVHDAVQPPRTCTRTSTFLPTTDTRLHTSYTETANVRTVPMLVHKRPCQDTWSDSTHPHAATRATAQVLLVHKSLRGGPDGLPQKTEAGTDSAQEASPRCPARRKPCWWPFHPNLHEPALPSAASPRLTVAVSGSSSSLHPNDTAWPALRPAIHGPDQRPWLCPVAPPPRWCSLNPTHTCPARPPAAHCASARASPATHEPHARRPFPPGLRT